MANLLGWIVALIVGYVLWNTNRYSDNIGYIAGAVGLFTKFVVSTIVEKLQSQLRMERTIKHETFMPHGDTKGIVLQII